MITGIRGFTNPQQELIKRIQNVEPEKFSVFGVGIEGTIPVNSVFIPTVYDKLEGL